jgi:hypothetical protein
MTLNYDDTVTRPLTTDALIEERIVSLVGRACRRQLWFLFLDQHDIQLPIIMPVADPPPMPDKSVPALARTIAEHVGDLAARSVIIVLERYADATFTAADAAWARALTEAFDATELSARGVLVSHRSGVRWFAPDDYRFGPP